jgi:hypothetical protein
LEIHDGGLHKNSKKKSGGIGLRDSGKTGENQTGNAKSHGIPWLHVFEMRADLRLKRQSVTSQRHP